MTDITRLHFFAARTKKAQNTKKALEKKYGFFSAADAQAIVALGGDGTLLESLHQHYHLEKPVYGMNLGSVGFLLNPFRHEDLIERVNASHSVELNPLRMQAWTREGEEIKAIAFNEVSLFRQRRQTAHLCVTVDNVERIGELVCDGLLIATPAGSTAYNLSAHGPILPLESNILALTPISPFRPRRWSGALLPARSDIIIKVLNEMQRPVSATADFTEVRHVRELRVWQSRGIGVKLLFDPDHHLEERILKEQFWTG